MENEGINNHRRFNENLYLRATFHIKLKYKLVQSARSHTTHKNTKDYGGHFTKRHIQTIKVTLVLANEQEWFQLIVLHLGVPQFSVFFMWNPLTELIQVNVKPDESDQMCSATENLCNAAAVALQYWFRCSGCCMFVWCLVCLLTWGLSGATGRRPWSCVPLCSLASEMEVCSPVLLWGVRLSFGLR